MLGLRLGESVLRLEGPVLRLEELVMKLKFQESALWPLKYSIKEGEFTPMSSPWCLDDIIIRE